MRPTSSEDISQKPKRKQAKRACTKCRSAKAGCSDTRPCNRCVSLNIGHLCSDAPPKLKNGENQTAFDSITPLFASNTPPIPSFPNFNHPNYNSQEYSLFRETNFENFTLMSPKTDFDTQGLVMSPIDGSRLSLPILPQQQQPQPHPQPQHHVTYSNLSPTNQEQNFGINNENQNESYHSSFSHQSTYSPQRNFEPVGNYQTFDSDKSYERNYAGNINQRTGNQNHYVFYDQKYKK